MAYAAFSGTNMTSVLFGRDSLDRELVEERSLEKLDKTSPPQDLDRTSPPQDKKLSQVRKSETTSRMSSPTPSNKSDNMGTNSISSDSEMDSVASAGSHPRCYNCTEPFSNPKVLACFHTYCQPCLEKMVDVAHRKIQCPMCKVETCLGESGVAGLKTNYAVVNMMESTPFDASSVLCSSCKTGAMALTRCIDCASYLCDQCTKAHRYMHCFSGHQVINLSDLQGQEVGTDVGEKVVMCPDHPSSPIILYCRNCRVPFCNQCNEHHGHSCAYASEVTHTEMGQLRMMADDAFRRATSLRANANEMAQASASLKRMYTQAQQGIDSTFRMFQALLEECRTNSLRQLDEAFNTKQVIISDATIRMTEAVEKLNVAGDFISRHVKNASPLENLLLKGFIEARVQNIYNSLPEVYNQAQFEIEFISSFQVSQDAIRNAFGYIRQGYTSSEPRKLPQPIARPNGFHLQQSSPTMPRASASASSSSFSFQMPASLPREPSIDLPLSASFFSSSDGGQYERWSNGIDLQAASPPPDVFSTSADPMFELAGRVSSVTSHPTKSNIRRNKMIYNHRFGEFGMRETQFTEPSGVCTNAQDNIIVADTNNHRIQVFDKNGQFMFAFGESGKRDGQLLYPNRVAVVRSTGQIVVTERSPTHQVQIYDATGKFERKFGANILQHPRGVAVDNRHRIVIVECKVMRVIIFDMEGNVINKFGCSKHLQFPNSVVVNDNEEIFISDNRAHAVKVFNYAGVFLREIGGEGQTNYPIGVAINSRGEILVADNHNNFNVTTYSQSGELLNAMESKVKHAQCFDVALLSDGTVVLASKDYKIYLYKYPTM